MAYTYAQLTQAVIDNSENDYSTFVSNIDDFIRKAELDIFRDTDLRAWRHHAKTIMNAKDSFITLPVTTPDTIVRDLFLIKPDGSYAFLQPRNYSWMRDYWPNKIRTGQPQFYAHWSTDIIAITPPADINYSIEIEYSALPTSLVDGGDTGSAVSLVLATGGLNYSPGDLLTLVGGSGPPAQINVLDTNTVGSIIAFTTPNTGSYLVVPQNPISVIGGKGSGAAFTITATSQVPSFATWLSFNGADALLAGSMIYALAFEKAEAQAVGETQQGTPGLWNQLYDKAIQRLNLSEARERLDDYRTRVPS